ncbi:MAG: PorT family protein [Gemmatimonadota bacterium]|nr:MAG: PorT family protein [Gemmatimonadota bacterium]
MKSRIITAAILSVCVTSSVEAQRSHIGIQAGPTVSTMTGDYITSTSGLELGFSFLATLDREFGEHWGIEAGVGWYQKGGEKLELADEGGDRYGYSTSYLEVPLKVRYKFRFSNFSLAPYSGVAIGLGLGCKFKPSEQFEFDDVCDEGTPGGNLQSAEVGIPIGLTWSIEFPGGSRFTIADVSYHLGLTNVFSVAKNAGQTARNSVWVYQFGFALPLYDESHD